MNGRVPALRALRRVRRTEIPMHRDSYLLGSPFASSVDGLVFRTSTFNIMFQIKMPPNVWLVVQDKRAMLSVEPGFLWALNLEHSYEN